MKENTTGEKQLLLCLFEASRTTPLGCCFGNLSLVPSLHWSVPFEELNGNRRPVAFSAQTLGKWQVHGISNVSLDLFCHFANFNFHLSGHFCSQKTCQPRCWNSLIGTSTRRQSLGLMSISGYNLQSMGTNPTATTRTS